MKWSVMAKNVAVLNESELASRVLSILITLCKFYPSKDTDGAVIRPLPKVSADDYQYALLEGITYLHKM